MVPKSLKSRDCFENLYHSGETIKGEAVKIIFLQEDKVTGIRYAIVTSTKFGGAVARNRIKRRIREIIRTKDLNWLQSCYFVIIPKKSSKTLTFKQLKADIIAQLERAQLIKND